MNKTDKEIMKEMLDRAGIDYIYQEPDKNSDQTSFEIHAGYIGFVSVIVFRADGSLKSIEAYE